MSNMPEFKKDEIEENFIEKVLVERSGQYELVDSKLLAAEKHLIKKYGGAKTEENPKNTCQNSIELSASPITRIRSYDEEGTKSASTTALPDKKQPPVSLKSVSQSSLQTSPYKGYERITRPRSSKRIRSASAAQRVQRSKAISDKEAIEKREMADAAFEHWKKQKDKEFILRRKEQKLKETKKAWLDMSNKKTGAEKEAFKQWLQNKSKQRTEEKHVEQVRAQLITAELLNVNYSESESAYERWLKRKNKAKIIQKKEKSRRTEEDREQMKVVLHNLKTRWNIDYNTSHYLHPNVIRRWDSIYG